MKQILNKLKNNPKKIFLLDALGAFLTASLLSFILAPKEDVFGMPSKTVYILSIIALCFFIYSFSCYKFIKTNWKPFLKLIIKLNSTYIIISVGLLFKHFNQLTFLGFTYFILEIIVIFIIVYLEIETYKEQKRI
jgi:hypothetical protein